MIKQGNTTSRAELYQQGWQYSHTFGISCEVWKKDDERVMWNPTTQIMTIVYNSDDRFATRGY